MTRELENKALSCAFKENTIEGKKTHILEEN